MPSTVEYCSELGVVEINHVGRVTGETFRSTTIEAFGLAKAHSTNLFLVDSSEGEGGGSLIDLYRLPDLYQELGLARGSKGAVVLPVADAKAEEDTRFYETVCRNRGWNVKAFTDRQAAIDWLTKT